MSDQLKIAYLLRDSVEAFNLKRGWRRVAWRLADPNGVDLVQPWFRTKGEAREFTKSQGWQIAEKG